MIWYVAVGSAIGGVSRYLLSLAIQERSGAAFPIGTLVVNISGSLLLGFLLRFALETPAITPQIRALLTTGFCGGYTTFSTFAWESVRLAEDGQYGRAATYVGLSVGVSLAGVLIGMRLARALIALRASA